MATLTGAEVKQARQRKHLTQKQLAKLVGVGLRTIGRWERGELDNLEDSHALGRLISALGLDQDTPNPTPAPTIDQATFHELLIEAERRYAVLERIAGVRRATEGLLEVGETEFGVWPDNDRYHADGTGG